MHKVPERLELKFKFFVVLLKGAQFSQDSYDSLWEFEALLNWILTKTPSLSGQRFLCWTDITIRNPEYAELREHELGEKVASFLADQSSWDATIMAAQANRMNPDNLLGITLKVALTGDGSVPPHAQSDVIFLIEDVAGGASGGVPVSEVPEIVGGAGAGGEELLEVEVEDVREVGGDVDDGAATAEEPPVPGTVTPSENP